MAGSHMVRWHSAKVHGRVDLLSVGLKSTGSVPLDKEDVFNVAAMYATETRMANTMVQTTNDRLCS